MDEEKPMTLDQFIMKFVEREMGRFSRMSRHSDCGQKLTLETDLIMTWNVIWFAGYALETFTMKAYGHRLDFVEWRTTRDDPLEGEEAHPYYCHHPEGGTVVNIVKHWNIEKNYGKLSVVFWGGKQVQLLAAEYQETFPFLHESPFKVAPKGIYDRFIRSPSSWGLSDEGSPPGRT